MKEARKFTRENPCTKVELWNCFTRRGAFRDRPLVDAKMEIGDNSVKYLAREGYMEQYTAGGVDMYRLTADGRAWLRKGTARYLELHPERIADCESPPGTQAAPTRVLRRTRRQ